MQGGTYTSGEQRRVLRVVPDLIRSREILLDLVTKDLRSRYRYAMMGFLWAVVEPLVLMLVLYFVFGVVFEMRGSGAATPSLYAVWLLCGLVFWQYLARTLGQGVRSLVDNWNLVSKVYFPREVIPLSSAGVNLVHLAFGVVILLILFLAVGGRPGLNALWILPVFAIEFVLVAGLLLLLSCLNVLYRDVAYITDVLLVLGFYATPIFYDYVQFVLPKADQYPWLVRLYPLNPMVGIVTAYRTALLENAAPSFSLLAWPLAAAALALAAGVILFRRRAGDLADHL